MPVSNIGSGITRLNTGNMASANSSALGMHVPTPTNTTTNGDFTTTSDGQVIAAREVTGVIRVKHNNVTIINSETMAVWIDTDKMGTKIHWTTGIVENGAVENTWGTTQIKGGDYQMVRCSLAGWIDHTRPQWGATWIVETWLGPSYKDPTGHTNNTPAHCDPSQPHPPPGSKPFTLLVFQGCKFEIFPFQDRNAGYLSQIGIFNQNLTATCGTINNEFYKCPNGIMRDCHWTGNASQIVMLQNGDNNTTNQNPVTATTNPGTQLPPMEGWAIFDCIFDLTGYPSFGSNRAFCNFGNTPGSVSPTIEWGRNTDINGNTLGAFYRSAPKATNDWGKTKPAKAADQYPSFYTGSVPDPGGDPPPDPVIQLKVTTPTPGQTFTSGTVTFVGGADTGDSDTNYNYFNYYISFPDEAQPGGGTGTGRIYLDRDSAGNNSGFTFSTISADGVTFTRRNGTAPETHKGRAQLTIVGERIGSSTWPEKTIEVTFGDIVTPPPPITSAAVDVTATFSFRAFPNLDTTIGGIPRSQITLKVKLVPVQFKRVWVPYWDNEKGGTGEEVEPVDATTFRRKV